MICCDNPVNISPGDISCVHTMDLVVKDCAFALVLQVLNHKKSYTLFSNSLVQTRPALSRKILSLLMARAKIVRAILVLLLSAPEQR